MSSILSAQNLQTLRRRNSVRRCACPLSPPFLSPPLPRPPPPERPCPNGIGLHLHAVEAIVFDVVHVLRASFTRLPRRRQAALDAPPLRFGLALGARALDHLLLLVDADDHVTNHQIDHPQP